MTNRCVTGILAGAACGALLMGCGGGGTKASGIATLTSDDPAGAVTTVAGDARRLTEDKALAFSKCMRDNGVQAFADPTVDADGNVQLFGRGGPGSPAGDGATVLDDPEFDAARTACQSLLEGVTFGGGRGGFQNNVELQDAFVKFGDCLRAEGLEVGDLTFGRRAVDGTGDGINQGSGPAGVQEGLGGSRPDGPPPAGAADGQRGPGGDPTARIARGLGLDTSDPAVAAALTTCQPILTDAFSSALGSTTTTVAL